MAQRNILMYDVRDEAFITLVQIPQAHEAHLLIGARGAEEVSDFCALKSCPPSTSVHWPLPPHQSACTQIYALPP